MKYLSIKEFSEIWGVSPTMVRKYCLQNRIPGAKRKDGVWLIPDTAKKPQAKASASSRFDKLHPLACKLVRQKTKKNYHGLYDYVQINYAYSSCRMASNRLTRGQVESIFRKGKVRESFEPVKVSDLIEVMNHCVCMDYIFDHIEMPLSVRFIKQLHEILTYGAVDDRLQKVYPGEFRNTQSKRKEQFVAPAEKINARLINLIDNYESRSEVTRKEILDFHVRFESIFPFEDANGRVGRLIMFKECLRHGVMPFILDDKKRTGYLEGIRIWDEDTSILADVVLDAQERFSRQVDLQKLGEYRDVYSLRPVDDWLEE